MPAILTKMKIVWLKFPLHCRGGKVRIWERGGVQVQGEGGAHVVCLEKGVRFLPPGWFLATVEGGKGRTDVADG